MLENLQTENILQKAALTLRKTIWQIEKKKLPAKNITAQDLISGEASIPQQLLDFYSILAGANQKRKNSLKSYADLNLHNIRKNTKQLQNFITTFDRFINPFSSELPKEQLINISSGKSASPPVEAYLLHIEVNGDHHRKAFISECLSDINRFEKAIKKTSVDNFSKDYEKKNKVQVGGISMDYKVDISKILSHPITSVPLSMCHLDGTICKTDKSALMKRLEKEVQHDQPGHIDVLIIDDYEHSQRFESAQLEFTITGPEQVRPSDFAKELKNLNFKEALVDFFISHWATDEAVSFIQNKIINVNFRQCHSFTVNSSNHVVLSVDEELSCSEHEEADTKIVYHACNINYQANIVIRSVDTDIAAIMLGNMHHLKNDSCVWILTGTGNNLRYVNLTKIHAELGDSICRSLPGFDAITGCDYNPAFFRKGKLEPYKILKKHQEYQKAFMKFGNNELIEDNDEQRNVFNIVQKFICNIYNVGSIIDVDAARLQMFIDSYTVSDVNEAFDRKKLRNFDASNLPPWDQLPNYVSDSLEIISETDEEGDIDINQEDWSSSDEDCENIDDNDENSEHY
ncbi:unnamed protein product [Psylliodes chrysocephalus]|uniref:Uncharacterized protein n=1 Tax=Psylliodes chrysocephalus TaxID=3402493 RepID=A0A9P0CX69_9CUCU|nr:unnamed protein product [Psylliodes chrysocephala]